MRLVKPTMNKSQRCLPTFGSLKVYRTNKGFTQIVALYVVKN